ncbi:MAG: hypothetical protein HFI76_06785 [Lachnospiraceae bacterium]|nr:hypothetical protein [Lachnospiraceae bacterium]
MFLDFEFDNERASDYGLIVGSFQGDAGMEILSSGSDLALNPTKPSRSDRFLIHHLDYSEPYTYTFQVIKNYCTAKNGDISLSPKEISSIQRWLCRRNSLHKFKIYAEGYNNLYWMGSFYAQQVSLNGKIVGLELTFTADSPYAYSEPISLAFDCKEQTPFEIYNMSDEEGAIHPHMEITFLKESDAPYEFTLSNSLDRRIMKIKGCTQNETITIDGKNLMIQSSNLSHTSLSKDFNYFFPKIINTYHGGKNTFTPNADCNITFTYSPICKVGLP